MMLQIWSYKVGNNIMRQIASFLYTSYTVATIKHHGHAKEDIQLQDSDVDHTSILKRGQIKVLYKVFNISKL